MYVENWELSYDYLWLIAILVLPFGFSYHLFSKILKITRDARPLWFYQFFFGLPFLISFVAIDWVRKVCVSYYINPSESSWYQFVIFDVRSLNVSEIDEIVPTKAIRGRQYCYCNISLNHLDPEAIYDLLKEFVFVCFSHCTNMGYTNSVKLVANGNWSLFWSKWLFLVSDI